MLCQGPQRLIDNGQFCHVRLEGANPTQEPTLKLLDFGIALVLLTFYFFHQSNNISLLLFRCLDSSFCELSLQHNPFDFWLLVSADSVWTYQ